MSCPTVSTLSTSPPTTPYTRTSPQRSRTRIPGRWSISHSTAPHISAQHDMHQPSHLHNVTQHCTVPPCSTPQGLSQHGTAQLMTICCTHNTSPTQHSTSQHGTTPHPHSTAQHSTLLNKTTCPFPQYLDQIRQAVSENLRLLTHSPSVQMHQVSAVQTWVQALVLTCSNADGQTVCNEHTCALCVLPPIVCANSERMCEKNWERKENGRKKGRGREIRRVTFRGIRGTMPTWLRR